MIQLPPLLLCPRAPQPLCTVPGLSWFVGTGNGGVALRGGGQVLTTDFTDYTEESVPSVKSVVGNFSKARIHSLGWEAKVSLKEGIALTYPWIEAQVKTARKTE